jgi:hypothetical protein
MANHDHDRSIRNDGRGDDTGAKMNLATEHLDDLHKSGPTEPDKKDKDVVVTCNSNIPPAIPNGNHYELVFRHAETVQQWGQTKLFLWFQMQTPGEWVGQWFYMACTVPPKGRFGPSSKFWLTWVLAAQKRPNRADRLSTAIFKNKVFRARMRKVLKTSKQIDRTPAQQYSVVDELLEVRAGQ